jgi:hypothetical protein
MLRRFGLYLVLALFGSVATASAAVVNDVDIATGWTHGTGPVGGHFAVDTVDGGIEIALRASLRTIGPITPVGNVYTAPVGTSGGLALWNFDFSINPGALVNPVSRLTITGPNGSTFFNAILIPDNTPLGGPFYQNSENLGFSFLSSAIGGFDPNLVGTYKFDLALFSPDTRTPVADVNIVVNTAAVPGPIVGAGLPGLVMALGGFVAWRRRRNQVAAA